MLRAGRNADEAPIADAAVFNVYRGKGIEQGRKSLAVAVTLQPQDATLTDADLEAASARIVGAVAKATGAVLRGRAADSARQRRRGQAPSSRFRLRSTASRKPVVLSQPWSGPASSARSLVISPPSTVAMQTRSSVRANSETSGVSSNWPR